MLYHIARGIGVVGDMECSYNWGNFELKMSAVLILIIEAVTCLYITLNNGMCVFNARAINLYLQKLVH